MRLRCKLRLRLPRLRSLPFAVVVDALVLDPGAAVVVSREGRGRPRLSSDCEVRVPADERLPSLDVSVRRQAAVLDDLVVFVVVMELLYECGTGAGATRLDEGSRESDGSNGVPRLILFRNERVGCGPPTRSRQIGHVEADLNHCYRHRNN